MSGHRKQNVGISHELLPLVALIILTKLKSNCNKLETAKVQTKEVKKITKVFLAAIHCSTFEVLVWRVNVKMILERFAAASSFPAALQRYF